MNRRKLLIIPLLIVVVSAIWFVNFRLLFRIKAQTAKIKPAVTASPSLPESLRNADFEFKSIKRDPFNVIVDTGPKEPVMPPFSLRGIVLTNSGALALMELPDGDVYPLKKGEKYLGVNIKKISPKEVTVEFRGRKQVFTVWE